MTGRTAVRDDPWGDYLARGGRDDPFERQWQTFLALSADRDPRRGPLPAWVPDPKQQCHTNVGILMAEGNFRTWEEVHGWSVRLRAAFWATAIRRLGIVFRTPPGRTSWTPPPPRTRSGCPAPR